MKTLVILGAVAATGALLAWPRLARARLWRASITPMASIIGSGFLVIGPILNTSFGKFAPWVMLALCAAAYSLGSAIRFNILRIDRTGTRTPLEIRLETVASWSLAFAYVISVAYYLNLLGAFAVTMTPLEGANYPRLVTSAVFAVILVVGWTRGFGALERLEQVSVGMKLAIIAGLLVGLAWFFAEEVARDALVIAPATVTGWSAVVLAFGLLVTVQGFETSRYLSAEYDAAERVRSMRVAQAVSTSIYMLYIGLMAFIFAPDTLELSETAIIDLMALVAPILPGLLVIAAVTAQFSAAVADTGGAGGLLSELTRQRLSPRSGYAILVALGLALTWGASVFELISYASRAFAVYYGLQCLIAAIGAAATKAAPLRSMAFLALAVLAFAAALFGVPVE